MYLDFNFIPAAGSYFTLVSQVKILVLGAQDQNFHVSAVKIQRIGVSTY